MRYLGNMRKGKVKSGIRVQAGNGNYGKVSYVKDSPLGMRIGIDWENGNLTDAWFEVERFDPRIRLVRYTY